MPSATLPPPPTAQPSAAQIVEKAADGIVEWAKLNPDQAHVASGETPGVPRDLAFWRGVEDELHVAIEDAVRNVLDQVGGPVPAGLGRRSLGS